VVSEKETQEVIESVKQRLGMLMLMYADACESIQARRIREKNKKHMVTLRKALPMAVLGMLLLLLAIIGVTYLTYIIVRR